VTRRMRIALSSAGWLLAVACGLKPSPSDLTVVSRSDEPRIHVLRGEIVTRSYRVQNRGRRLITPRPLSGTCESAVTLSMETIEPGQIVEARVVFDTTHYPEGDSEADAFVSVDGGRANGVRLTAQFNVTREFELSSTSVQFVDDNPDQRSVALRLVGGARVLGVTSTDPAVQAAFETGGGEGEYAIKITQSSMAAGPHSGVVVLSTSSRYYPEIRIPVRGGRRIETH